MRSPALFLYRLLWDPALLAARGLACFGAMLPRRWALRERLAPPDLAAAREGRLWLHAASLGECKGLWAFAQSLAALPCGFVLTANTLEGRDFLRGQAAKQGDPERWAVTLAPLDHPRAVRRFLQATGTRGLVLFEVELWPHFLSEARRAGLPAFWISARLTRRAARRYGIVPGAMRAMLGAIDWIQAQSEKEAEALRAAGGRVVEAGADLRGLHYLAAQSLTNLPRGGPDETAGRGAHARNDGNVRTGIVFLSFHADELETLKALLQGLRDPAWVLPRKSGEFERFRTALAPLGFESFSRNPKAGRVVVDAFGFAGEALSRARGAVVGGSFADHGGHNLWEPLAAGVPAAIGPYHESQAWLASRLEAEGMLQIVRSVPETGAGELFGPIAAGVEAKAAPARETAARVRETLGVTLGAATERALEAIKQRVRFGEAR